MPISVTPLGRVTGSISASCDFTHTVRTAKVSKASRVTSVLRKRKQKLYNVVKIKLSEVEFNPRTHPFLVWILKSCIFSMLFSLVFAYTRTSFRAVARTLIGGVYIHIFGFCPTDFF